VGLQEWLDSGLREVAGDLARSIRSSPDADTGRHFSVANREAVHAVLVDLLAALFPGTRGSAAVPGRSVAEHIAGGLRAASVALMPQIEQAYRHMCLTKKCEGCDCHEMAFDAVSELMTSLPAIRSVVAADLQAAYEGDPAALSVDEVVMGYRCVEAISVQRMAHVLYDKGVPVIPRIMCEWAHSRTGIDIHPGARIGSRFFVDHGTGVVIGETCTIGDNVKVYQGVTLGALSFPLDEDGKPVKGVKRHPDIEDDVTIYGGATILGGDTVVGKGSVIGGNVWLTHSVPPYSVVYNTQPEPRVVNRNSHDAPKDLAPGSGPSRLAERPGQKLSGSA
jgi:serine O-acetyltransferase